MNTSTEASVTWAQALAWRMERQLLDPVGSASVAGVVRRLGAVLAMDESLAELAVRTRRTTSRPGELAAALAGGDVIKAFAFRGAVHYLSPEEGGIYLALRSAGRQWELPSWVEHYRLTASEWPDFRGAVRAALSDGPLTVVELGEALTRHRAYRHLTPVFEQGAGTLIKPLTWQGDMSFGPPRDGRRTFQRLDSNPRWRGIPDLDDAGPRAITAYFRTYGPATFDHLHYWLGEGLSAGPAAAQDLVLRARRPAGRGRCRGHRGVRPARGRRRPRGHASLGGSAVPPRARPVGDRSRHQGRPRHPVDATRPDDPEGQPGDRRRGRVRDVGAQGGRAHRHLARCGDAAPTGRSSRKPGDWPTSSAGTCS